MSADKTGEIAPLHGFRAIMILMVCNFHIWQLGWLSQSITLFGQKINFDYITRSSYMFVDGTLLLSGFLLYLPYARRLPERPDALFYKKRAMRILPSYLFCVLVTLVIAIASGSYPDLRAAALDVLAHLTFTFMLFKETYLFTPLNAALWTLAVEAWFYLIFPYLARAARRKPALTLCAMASAGMLYRALVLALCEDTAMFLNQLPAFMDVYALGFLGAIAYAALERLNERQKKLVSALSPALMALGVWLACALLFRQSTASAGGYEALRRSQLTLRLPWAVAMLMCLMASSTLPRALRWIMGGRAARFLSAFSLNLYIWHQTLSNHIMRGMFPPTLHADPQLQRIYTLLCVSCSLIAATIVTYCVEKPAYGLSRSMKGSTVT